MLSGEFADDRQLEKLLLVGLVHQEDPDSKASDDENQHQRQSNQAKDSGRQRGQNGRQDHPDDPESDPRDIKENGLESVKADEGVRLVGIQDEEDDAGDEAGEIR